MSDLAEHHRRIATALEPIEQLDIAASVEERTTDKGGLSLTVTLGPPPDFDSIDDERGETGTEIRHEQGEQLRKERDRLQKQLDRIDEELETVQSTLRAIVKKRGECRERVEKITRRAETLEERIAELEARHEDSEPDRKNSDAGSSEDSEDAHDELTDGERETLNALQALGGAKASGEIANEVDATLQSVRSWLPKLVQADLIRTTPDPTDGRRKLYSPIESDEPTDSDESEDPDNTFEESGEPDKTDDNAETRDTPGEQSQTRGKVVDSEEETDTTDEQSDDPDNSAEKPESRDCTDELSGDADGTVEESEDVATTVYIASSGGSPSQVYHVRKTCPQLQRSADFVEKERTVVPHHRPCGSCVADGLAEGVVAIANNSATKTYHKRKDCPRLASANTVTVQDKEIVPDFDPCPSCVHRTEEDSSANGDKEDSDSRAAEICAGHHLDREEIIKALDTATAIYHIQRDLTLSREETEALLKDLGVFEALDGGGHVPLERAKSAVRDHVPAT